MKVHFLLSITISRLYFIDWIASNQIKASLHLNFLQIISLRL